MLLDSFSVDTVVATIGTEGGAGAALAVVDVVFLVIVASGAVVLAVSAFIVLLFAGDLRRVTVTFSLAGSDCFLDTRLVPLVACSLLSFA